MATNLQSQLLRLERERNALVWALCNVLDGTAPHDYPAEFGISSAESDVLAEIHRRAHARWVPDTVGTDLPMDY